jgi:hypothetical protein
MFIFFAAAIAEIAIGLFAYQLLNPEKAEKRSWFLRWNWIDVEATFLDFKKDLKTIKKANKFILNFCFIVAGLILIDGILVTTFDFTDFKEILLIGTMVVILPLKYFYIFIKKITRKHERQEKGSHPQKTGFLKITAAGIPS